MGLNKFIYIELKLAMLKMITQRDKDIAQGNVHDVKMILTELRNCRGL